MKPNHSSFRIKTLGGALTLLLSLAFLSGCKFHDNPPNLDVPQRFTSDNTANPKIDLAQNPWWENLGSAELNRLVEEGLEKNKNITLAMNSVEQAQSALDTIKLGWLPTFSFLLARSSGNSDLYVGNQPVPVSSGSSMIGFVPWFLFNIFELPNKTKEASKRVEVSAADYLAVRTSVSAQIVAAYTVLLASQEEEVL